MDLDSSFDFSEMFADGFLTDCELHLPPCDKETGGNVIKAHRIVLANASEVFYNTFTSGMQESITGVVNIDRNPFNLFPRVVNWMYSGQIEFALTELMPLLSIARNYGICELEKKLFEALCKSTNNKTIMFFIQQCFDHNLPDELLVLEPLIVNYLDDIPIKTLSDALDVVTFAHVLTGSTLSNDRKISMINDFLGDWDPSEEEKEALGSCLTIDASLIQRLKKQQFRWLPDGFGYVKKE